MTDDPTVRIPAVDDTTQPINNHDHRFNQHRDARDPLFWRAVAVCAAVTVLVATGLAYATGSLVWILLVWPGAPLLAMAVVVVALLVEGARKWWRR